MFNAKNFSPNKLSFFTALCLSVPVSIAFYVVSSNMYAGVGAFIVTLLGSYLLIRFVLESFIDRKLKLIYKFIYKKKASKKDEMY